MKREELVEYLDNGDLTHQFVLDMYDDFESRTCENCNHYYKYIDMDFGKCMDGGGFVDGTHGSYGCNRFERKEKL